MDFVPNFAVFEGIDGSGTTTQLDLLGERMKTLGKPAFFPTFEPYKDGKTHDLIRDVLKKQAKMSPEDLCLLFAENRKEHLYAPGGVMEHINKGFLVVSDRYVLSSLVYQGIECGEELPKKANSLFPAPELTIFFDLEPEIARERMKNRPSLEIYEYIDFQKKVRAQYLVELEKYEKQGARVEKLDASKSMQEVSDKVWSIIREMPIFKT
jgi:dTMP kinase